MRVLPLEDSTQRRFCSTAIPVPCRAGLNGIQRERDPQAEGYTDASRAEARRFPLKLNAVLDGLMAGHAYLIPVFPKELVVVHCNTLPPAHTNKRCIFHRRPGQGITPWHTQKKTAKVLVSYQTPGQTHLE